MKRKPRKLALNKETLRSLGDSDLRKAGGGTQCTITLSPYCLTNPCGTATANLACVY